MKQKGKDGIRKKQYMNEEEPVRVRKNGKNKNKTR